jgi:hypothetical protein
MFWTLHTEHPARTEVLQCQYCPIYFWLKHEIFIFSLRSALKLPFIMFPMLCVLYILLLTLGFFLTKLSVTFLPWHTQCKSIALISTVVLYHLTSGYKGCHTIINMEVGSLWTGFSSWCTASLSCVYSHSIVMVRQSYTTKHLICCFVYVSAVTKTSSEYKTWPSHECIVGVYCSFLT